jgi:hypothetical protein
VANIGSLAVQLSTDASKFTSGLKQAEAEAVAWAQKVGKSLNLAGVAGALSAGPAGLVGLGAGALGGSFMADMQNRIGQLANVRVEATKAGVSVADFMKFTGRLGAEETAVASAGLSKMTKNLAELSMGSQEMATRFEQIGLDPVKLQEMGVADATREVAKRFAEAKSSVEQAQIAITAFGKAGQDMIPILGKMGDQIGGKFEGMRPEDVYQAGITRQTLAAGTKKGEVIKTKFALELSRGVNAISDAFEGDWRGMAQQFGFLGGRYGANLSSERAAAQEAADEARTKSRSEAQQITAELIKTDERLTAAQTRLRTLDPGGTALIAETNRLRDLEVITSAERKGRGLTPEETERFRKLTAEAKAADVNRFTAGLSDQAEAFRAQAAAVGKSAAEMAAWTARMQAAKMEAAGVTVDAGKLEAKIKEVEEAAGKFEKTQVEEAVRSPLEVFNDELERFGKLDLGGVQKERALGKAFEALKAGVTLPGQGAAAAPLEFGTAAAVSEELQFQRRGLLPQGPQEELKRVIQEATRAQGENSIRLGDLSKAIQNWQQNNQGFDEVE